MYELAKITGIRSDIEGTEMKVFVPEKNLFNTLIILIVAIIMIVFSITATSFSSIYYILICGVIGVIVYFFKKNIQR